MPNWVSVTILGMNAYEEERFDESVFVDPSFSFCKTTFPTDDPKTDWGMNRRDYNVTVSHPGGDGGPIAIHMECAWNEPHPVQMRRIFDYLESQHGLCALIAVALDPYDSTSRVVEVAPK